MIEGVDYPMGATEFEYSLVQDQLKRLPRFNTYLEIGSRMGGSLRSFGGLAREYRGKPASVLAVDRPGVERKEKARDKEVDKLHRAINDLQKEGIRCNLIAGNSKDPSTVKSVRDYFGDDCVDVLFIDGGHDFYTVASDVHNYASLVGKGGIVLFHDCGFIKSENWVSKPDKVNGLVFNINSVHGVFRAFSTGRKYILVQQQWGLEMVWK